MRYSSECPHCLHGWLAEEQLYSSYSRRIGQLSKEFFMSPEDWHQDIKKAWNQFAVRSTLRGSGMPITVRTDNARAHADMNIVLPIRDMDKGTRINTSQGHLPLLCSRQ